MSQEKTSRQPNSDVSSDTVYIKKTFPFFKLKPFQSVTSWELNANKDGPKLNRYTWMKWRYWKKNSLVFRATAVETRQVR